MKTLRFCWIACLALIALPGCAPDNLRTMAATPTIVHLAWDHNEFSCAWEPHGFMVERRLAAENGWTEVARIPSCTIHAFRDDTVAQGTHYVYRIRSTKPREKAPLSNEAKVTTPRPRRSLGSLTPAERRQLVDLMLKYLTDDVVARHQHFSHAESALFTQHRTFLAAMEAFLRKNGGSKFVPLPTWDPGTSIPDEFNVVKPRDGGPGRPPIHNLDPRLPLPSYLRANVRQFGTLNDLSDAISPWHSQVHWTIGGVMTTIPESPAAPIFWCWHAFIDDLFTEWLATREAGEFPGLRSAHHH